jgi:biotin-(acetyl-CoA carboxylase) ligase
LTGRDVRVSGPDTAVRGRVSGVDDDGALLLVTDAGTTTRVLAGEVTLRSGGGS